MVFNSAAEYIECATSIKDKIARIDAIINALLTTALKAVETGNIQQYSLDNGQTKINTAYRNPKEVLESIEGFERIKTLYSNKLTPKIVRLVDSKNFRH